MSDNKDTRTATQRIDDLESVVTALFGTVKALDRGFASQVEAQKDMVLVRDALRLLNKKTEAIVQTAKPESGITPEAVSDLVIKMNVEDLKDQVTEYLKRGSVVPTEEVSATSFLVCEEQNADGTVVNPRIQFRLDSQDPETQALFNGKRVGDTISFGEGKFSAKILELYTLVDNPAPQKTPQVAPQDVVPTQENSAPTVTPIQNELPAESPVEFGLTFHGQPEADLSASSTKSQN